MQLTDERPSTRLDPLPTALPAGDGHAEWAEAQLALPLMQMLRDLGPRDPELREHCEAVGDLAGRIGRRLGLSAVVIARLRLAGVLHDIGKVAIPDRILHKAGPLDADEWDQVRRHPETGCRLIRAVGLEEIADWVLSHHERYDGRGYPSGAAAGQIPLGGAILAVADAYHAMTAERPYQTALSAVAARAELLRCAGAQFDPAVVAALFEVVAAPLARGTT